MGYPKNSVFRKDVNRGQSSTKPSLFLNPLSILFTSHASYSTSEDRVLHDSTKKVTRPLSWISRSRLDTQSFHGNTEQKTDFFGRKWECRN